MLQGLQMVVSQRGTSLSGNEPCMGIGRGSSEGGLFCNIVDASWVYGGPHPPHHFPLPPPHPL
eukprot:6765278-Pyramimonas_sp.AAC.1